MTDTQQIIQLLQKINENTTSSAEFRIAVVTAIAAISGTLIGAVVTYLTTRLQVRHQATITANELRANTMGVRRESEKREAGASEIRQPWDIGG